MTTTLDSQLISQDTKRCKFCAENINVEAIKCKHCGSSLTPNSFEKIKAHLKTDRGKVVSVISACFLLILSGVFINQSNKAKEMKLLNESGQICIVSQSDPSASFGCTNYPTAEIYFCATAKVLRPYWPDRDFETLQIQGANYNDRIAGIPGGDSGHSCVNSSAPNLFLYKWESDFRVGNYEVRSVEYEYLEDDSYGAVSGGGNFIVEISIKK